MADIETPAVFQAACKAPFGWVAVATRDGAVCELDIFQQKKPGTMAAADPLAEEVCAALQRWFAGGVWPADIPVAPEGTAFQKKVWRALQQIPVGETRTYGELARKLGSGPRAVGGACRRNPVPLLIPCHRVVAANGDGGFAGRTDGRRMEIKRWLLNHE
ncbi:methylated-DNA--[protein]-cysteine S-methyltransferase [Thiolapillus sp.]